MAKLPEEMNVTISFSPETLSEAVEIIRSSINGDRDMRNAWIASVQNWLNDFDRCSISTLARDFVDWLAEGDVPTEHAQNRDSAAGSQDSKLADMVSSLSDGCECLDDQWAYALRHDRS
jgi:hypothetical protein